MLYLLTSSFIVAKLIPFQRGYTSLEHKIILIKNNFIL